MEGQVDTSGRCCICLDSLDTEGLGRQWLPCGHVMHELCITELRRQGASGRCPVCRASHADLTPVQDLVDQAVVHNMRREHAEEVRLYEEVLSVDPSHPLALNNLAGCYHQGLGVLRDLPRAIELYEEARKGGAVWAALNLGLIYHNKGDPQKAEKFYEEARRGGHLVATFNEATFNLGVLCRSQGNFQRAEELFEEAHAGGHLDSTYNRGISYHLEGDLQRAKEMYEKVRRGRRDVEATFNLATIYQKQGDLRQAKGLYEEAHRGGCMTATFNLGILFGDQGNLQKAEELLEQALRGGHAEAASFLKRFREQQELEGSVNMGGSDSPHTRDSSTTACSASTSFVDGDSVTVHGLTSAAGQQLNGRSGTIVRFDALKGRYGVKFAGCDDPKAIRGENLNRVLGQSERLASGARFIESVAESVEELAEQAAIEESVFAAQASQDAGSINARISDFVVRSPLANEGPRVLLLKFDRPSIAMRDILLRAEELATCRTALEALGHPVELESGAMIFVRPEHYDPSLTAIRLYGWPLHKNHVLVDLDLEDIVLRLVRQLHGRSFTYLKDKGVVPLGLAESATSSGYDLVVTGTFLQIRVPSSLYSESDPGAARTASTTDADPRKHASSRHARRGGGTGSRS